MCVCVFVLAVLGRGVVFCKKRKHLAYGSGSLLFACRLQYRMLDPSHLVETVTVEEDPRERMPVISVETNEDGTTRRTETTVSLFEHNLY